MTPGWDELWARGGWAPIRGCPGRFVARAPGLSALAPAELVGADTEVARFAVAGAHDPVLVAALRDRGGLITYARAGGSYVHTLNTDEGFARKLAQLGIAVPARPPR